MSRSVADPPSMAELGELARVVAARRPHLMPAFLGSVCRSTKAAKACRQLPLPAAELAELRELPKGAQLIAASRRDATWLRRARREEMGQAVDELLAPSKIRTRTENLQRMLRRAEAVDALSRRLEADLDEYEDTGVREAGARVLAHKAGMLEALADLEARLKALDKAGERVPSDGDPARGKPRGHSRSKLRVW